MTIGQMCISDIRCICNAYKECVNCPLHYNVCQVMRYFHAFNWDCDDIMDEIERIEIDADKVKVMLNKD